MKETINEKREVLGLDLYWTEKRSALTQLFILVLFQTASIEKISFRIP